MRMAERVSEMLYDLFRRRCGKCRFFEHERWASSVEYGYCVRNPPGIRPDDPSDPVGTDTWPRVPSHFSVCGEFRRGRRVSR